MPLRDPKGFTLVELMIVAALVVVIAAIAIPGLMRARLSGTEGSAVASLRAINSAQSTFASSCGANYYAPSLTRLSTPPADGGEGFIGTDLASDPSLKSGYRFTMTAGVASAASPASCNGAAAGSLPTTYFMGADPVSSSSGSRYFGTNQGGTIYQSDTAIAVTQNGQPAGTTPVQ